MRGRVIFIGRRFSVGASTLSIARRGGSSEGSARAQSRLTPAIRTTMLIENLLRGTTRREILFPTRTHQGAATDRWMCTPASREARCGQSSGSPLTKVGAKNSFRPAEAGVRMGGRSSKAPPAISSRNPLKRPAPQRRHPVRRLQRRRLRRQEGERRRQRLRRLPLLGQLRRRVRLLRLDRRRHGQELLGLRPGGVHRRHRQQRQRLQDGRRQGLGRARHVELLRLRQRRNSRGLARLRLGLHQQQQSGDHQVHRLRRLEQQGGSFQSISHSGDVTASTTTAKASTAKRDADGSLPAITSL